MSVKLARSSVPRAALRAARAVVCASCMVNAQAAPASDAEDLAMAFGDQATISLATGSSLPLRRAPAVASVITAEQIAAMGARDLDDVLEAVPGLHVSRVAQGYSPQYVVRGIYSEFNPQTLVLQNGVPITMLFVGNRGNAWGGFPLENVSRIEIIRGPGSALYGADAYAGVINIITKGPDEVSGTTVGARVGSFNTTDAWLLHGATLGAFDVVTHLRWGASDGHDGTITSDAQTALDQLQGTSASLAPGSVNTGYQALDASIDARLDDLRMSLSYRLRDKLQSGAGAASAIDPLGRGRTERWLADLNWRRITLTPDWQAAVNLSWFSYTTTYPQLLQLLPPGAFNGAFPAGMLGSPNTWERQIRGSVVFTYSGWAGHQIRLGLGHDDLDMYRTQEFKNFTQAPNGAGVPLPGAQVVEVPVADSFVAPQRRRVSYVYVQDEWSIAPDWQLTAGLRHDQYSDFGGTTNPRLALVWDTSLDFTTKFLFGRAFRAPSFSELYSVNNPVLRGNPDLKPEVITTFETVFTWQARADTQWQLSLFKYDMKDIIRSTGLPAIRANSGRQSGEGFELEAQHRLAPDWQFTGHYAFQRTIDRSTGQSAGYAPRHHLYGRVDWLADHGWAVGLQANRVAGRERAAGDARAPVPDYTTVDLSLRSPANTRSGQWTLTVHNLFDADVREPSWYSPNSLVPVLIADDLPMAGRSIMLQWQYAL